MISVGVVAEGKYLTRDGVREPKEIFNRETEQNLWIKDHLSCGTQVGQHYITSEYSFRLCVTVPRTDCCWPAIRLGFSIRFSPPA